MAWPKLSRDTEITPGQIAADALIKIWNVLVPIEIQQSIAAAIAKALKDVTTHSLTLTSDTGDTPSRFIIRGVDPTDPTKTLWGITQEGDLEALSLIQYVAPGGAPNFILDGLGVMRIAGGLTMGGTSALVIGLNQVVGPRLPALVPTYITPVGGTTVDTQARAATQQLASDLASVRTVLSTHGLTG